MRELLGLVVFSMPILALLCIGGLAGYVGLAAGRQVEDPRRKWFARAAAGLTVVLVFVWDEVAGRVYLEYLCAIEGGSKIYKRIRLPADYWRADGSPVFLDQRGNKVGSRLDEDYQFGSASDE